MDDTFNQLLALVSPSVFALASFTARKFYQEIQNTAKDLEKRISALESTRSNHAERLAVAEVAEEHTAKELERLADRFETLSARVDTALAKKR